MSAPVDAGPAKVTEPAAEAAPVVAAAETAPEPEVVPAPELVAILETLAQPAQQPPAQTQPSPPLTPRERLKSLAQLSSIGQALAEATPAAAPAPSAPATAAIELHDLTLGYDGHPAVHHLDGTFAMGSLTAVVGPNGSGKSTLLKGIMGQVRPLGGHLHVHAGAIAYMPQQAEIDRGFPARVADLVGLGAWARRGAFGGYGFAERTSIGKALATVGLEGFARRPIDTLSGGQLQRALFARVLVQDAPVILLDEPFTAIDEQSVNDLMTLVTQLHAEGRTVVAVLHDLDLVRRHFPRTLLLAREPIGWGETSTVLTDANLARARRMPEAWDDRAPWHTVPDPHDHGAHK